MAEPPVEIDIVAAFGGTNDYGQRFAIYVPNKDRDGAPVAQAEWIDATIRLLADVAGGATAMPPVTGAWRNPRTGALIVEEPVVVYAYVKPGPSSDEWDERQIRVRSPWNSMVSSSRWKTSPPEGP